MSNSHIGHKPILVLTHTNAGVAALRSRLNRAGVRPEKYRLATIDGWAIRLISTFPGQSGHDPNIITGQRPNYTKIREAASKLLKAKHISDVITANYARLFVDEYQDCSIRAYSD
jgi:DNA helicase-2/ATP-dependent DNA helicase PcrA